MTIENTVLSGIAPVKPTVQQSVQGQQRPEKTFGDMLKSAINEVSMQEHESDKKTEQLAKGNTDNLHDVMITAQKANIKVETAVQVQQKVIDTYNEMMRMQI